MLRNEKKTRRAINESNQKWVNFFYFFLSGCWFDEWMKRMNQSTKRKEINEMNGAPSASAVSEWMESIDGGISYSPPNQLKEWMGAALSFIKVGYRPEAHLRRRHPFRQFHCLHFFFFGWVWFAPAKTGSPKFISSLISEVKGREWFVCWPAAHNQLPSAASGMKKQTHSLQQIKICLREWRTATLPALSIQSPMKTKKV